MTFHCDLPRWLWPSLGDPAQALPESKCAFLLAKAVVDVSDYGVTAASRGSVRVLLARSRTAATNTTNVPSSIPAIRSMELGRDQHPASVTSSKEKKLDRAESRCTSSRPPVSSAFDHARAQGIRKTIDRPAGRERRRQNVPHASHHTVLPGSRSTSSGVHSSNLQGKARRTQPTQHCASGSIRPIARHRHITIKPKR